MTLPARFAEFVNIFNILISVTIDYVYFVTTMHIGLCDKFS